MDKVQEMIKILDRVQNLPTLPVVIEKLRSTIRDPSSDAIRIARIIADDPSMMARILKIVNSALYGSREPISVLPLAVSRMGFTAISNIAMATAVFSCFGKAGQRDFDRERFWQHSISTGIASAVLYERCKPSLSKRYSRDILHLAGLLHDIGKIILEQFFHDDFMRAISSTRERGTTLIQAETDIMGADHVQIGSWLGLRWNLSQELLQVIRWHHDPALADVEHRELVMLCHSANYICNLEKIGDGGDTVAPTFQHDTWTRLGLTVRDISEIVDLVVEESKQSEILMSFVK